MRLSNRMLLQLVFIFYCLASTVSFAAAAVPEMPDNYVVDLAGIINDDVELNLNAYLRELEQKTTAQVVVLTVQSLEGESIEEASLRTAEKWRLGQKGKDNGLLLFVSVQDRKYRFEVGYGLEGILPDSLVGSIGREYLVPYFRKGDYSGGIFLSALAAANKIASNEGVEITGMPKIEASSREQGVRGKKQIGVFDAIIGIAFLIGLLILFIKNPRLFLLLMLALSMGGRRSGWSGGRGFGGGGFGGGGGGFGGGGASGRW